MTIKLPLSEVMTAAWVGVRRRLSHLRNARTHKFPTEKYDVWAIDIEGAAAEMAVCKYFNRYWNALHEHPELLDGDAQGGLQVRHTQRPNGGLFLHDEDADDQPFVLVVGAIPTFILVGWIMGRDGKKQEFWKEGIDRPAYLVPQDQLLPIETLTEIL